MAAQLATRAPAELASGVDPVHTMLQQADLWRGSGVTQHAGVFYDSSGFSSPQLRVMREDLRFVCVEFLACVLYRFRDRGLLGDAGAAELIRAALELPLR